MLKSVTMNENELIDKPLSVSEINSLVRTFIKERFYNLCITGEVSTFRPSANGHWYFKLKDANAQIDAVMFRSANALSSFVPKEGDKVEVRGSIDVYEARGTYQVIVQSIRHSGLGELLAAIQKRKEYYQSLGWFEPEGKPPLPQYPRNIGVITASTGAAIHDILDTTAKRAPSVDITIYPVLVQGSGAAAQIAQAIRQANDLSLSDVLIVGRGGGSFEDLLPFSEDEVIRAVHESQIPVISAVGHEIDTALSDYAATKRAITPTDAAMIATEGWHRLSLQLRQTMAELSSALVTKSERLSRRIPDTALLRSIIEHRLDLMKPADLTYLERLVDQKHTSLSMRLSFSIDSARDSIDKKTERAASKLNSLLPAAALDVRKKASSLEPRLMAARPEALRGLFDSRYAGCAGQLASLCSVAELAMKAKLDAAASALAHLEAQCRDLNPENVLQRGYAIVFDSNENVVRHEAELTAGDMIKIKVADGSFSARVAAGEGK